MIAFKYQTSPGNYRSNKIKPPKEEKLNTTGSIEPKVTVELENAEENAADNKAFLPEDSNEINIETRSPRKTFIPEQNYDALTRERTQNKSSHNPTDSKYDHSPIKYSRNYRKGCYKSDIVGHRARMELIKSLVYDEDVNDVVEPVKEKKKLKKKKKTPKKTSGVRFSVSSEDDYETLDELARPKQKTKIVYQFNEKRSSTKDRVLNKF